MSKKCTQCNAQNEVTTEIPLVAAESEAIRQHRIICKLIWVIVLLTVLLFGSNLAWTLYDSQFENVVETYDIEQDTEHGNNNCIIKGGEICNGTSEN